MGTPENAGVTLHVRPHVGPQEGKHEVATLDFVPFDGDPRERKGCVALPPHVGLQEGTGEVATFDFVPFDGDPRERRGYTMCVPLCGPLIRQECGSHF